MSQDGRSPIEHDGDGDSKCDDPLASSKDEQPKAKKRTKTGCLTCRRRRIKCGEERPICKNCIKSKRDCAGYNPPSMYSQIAGQPSREPMHLNPSSHPQQFVQNSIRFPLQAYDDSAVSSATPFGHVRTASHISAAPVDTSTALASALHSDRHELHLGSIASSQFTWPLHTPGTTLTETQPVPFQNTQTVYHDAGTSIPGLPTNRTQQRNNARADALPPALMHMPYSSPLPTGTPVFQPMYELRQIRSNDQYDDPEDPYDVIEDTSDPIGQANFAHSTHLTQVKTIQAFPPYESTHMHYLDRGFRLLASLFPHSPLLDDSSQTAFKHFIQVIGRVLSLFDRIEVDPISGLQSVPWTNELPKLALQHPAFAHAIVSVGAVHWARLHNANDDISVEHFTCALQQVKGLLEAKATRGQVSTLATILLLAYYEVITGDHSRWSLHISGAAKLIMEIDFAEVFRAVLKTRKSGGFRETQHLHGDRMPCSITVDELATLGHRLMDDEEWDIDEKIVRDLTGQHVDYDTQSQSDKSCSTRVATLCAREFREAIMLMDLFWCHCKQDLFQCMLSGDGPMLPYSKWKFCPPRGKIGIADKAYATVDHLWLILGRLTDFGYRDRARKLRVVASNGGEWRPPPGFLARPPSVHVMPMDADRSSQLPRDSPFIQSQALREVGPPVANESRLRSAKRSEAAPSIPMYGMIPPPSRPIKMPPSFTAMEAELNRDDLPVPGPEDPPAASDLASDLQAALREHAAISSALDQFVAALGPDFQPSRNDQPPNTPFGTALEYRTPVIAAMWAFYHVARIICRRSHPHSPPAAMVSAGVNASVTYKDAQQVGRVCGGLLIRQNLLSQAGQADWHVTAALMEVAFAMLFAAVQYQDSAQRSWTIDLFETLTYHFGSTSSSALASACETTWAKMGEAGKGPPYLRTLFSEDGDIRLIGKNVKMEGSPQPTGHLPNPVQEHESRFVHHDRNLINRHASTRTFWALGLLSVEEDLKIMSLNNEELRNL